MDMDWISLQKTGVEMGVWFVRLTIIFGVITWLMPCNHGMFWWKNLRGAATDLFYYFLMPLAMRAIKVGLVLAGLSLVFGDKPGFAQVRALPLELQCVLILLLQDVMLYWIHRGFHGKLAWRFHAVHHSTKTLDWLSAVRFHAVNDLFTVVLADAAVLMLGFSNDALLLLIPINIYYSAMVHANLNWTFGPLRFIFASPVFHRWHHVAEGQGCNMNYAPTFAFLDVLFGTFYMPAGAIPENFGTHDDDVPEGFLGQLIYPFLPKRSVETAAAETPHVAGLPLAAAGNKQRRKAA